MAILFRLWSIKMAFHYTLFQTLWLSPVTLWFETSAIRIPTTIWVTCICLLRLYCLFWQCSVLMLIRNILLILRILLLCFLIFFLHIAQGIFHTYYTEDNDYANADAHYYYYFKCHLIQNRLLRFTRGQIKSKWTIRRSVVSFACQLLYRY